MYQQIGICAGNGRTKTRGLKPPRVPADGSGYDPQVSVQNADANLGHPGTRGLSGRDAERLADFDLVGIGQVVGLRDLGILVGVAIKQLADL